jgi:hypothetical protein
MFLTSYAYVVIAIRDFFSLVILHDDSVNFRKITFSAFVKDHST